MVKFVSRLDFSAANFSISKGDKFKWKRLSNSF
jgi:hypothetical protein